MAGLARFGVIWLHGLGDTGRGWSFLESQIGPQLTGAVGGQIAWRFPTAPTSPVRVNGGMAMTSWMNLDEIPVLPSSPDYSDDIEKSLALIYGYLDELEAEGIPSSRVILGGFSQVL
eukprot:SAG31_NODE_14088_length_828_cov_0.876543_2_plen_117_part_00